MIDRVAFTIFGKEIYWYGITMTLAILSGVIITRIMFRRKKMDPELVTDLAILIVPLAVIGARTHYVIWSWEEFSGQPFWHVFAMWEGGMAIYGGLIGGILATFLFSRWKKIRFGIVLDCLAPGMALGQAIGRWGNFFNQEVYGRLITDPELQFFPFGVFIEATGTWHQALFFYECCLNFISFLVLLFVITKKTRTPGTAACWYVEIYGVIRASLEPLRTEVYIQNVNGVAVNQLFAIGVALVGVAGLIILPILEKKRNAGIVPEAEEVMEGSAEGSETAAEVPGEEESAAESEMPAEPDEETEASAESVTEEAEKSEEETAETEN